jgi:hypothetical protein
MLANAEQSGANMRPTRCSTRRGHGSQIDAMIHFLVHFCYRFGATFFVVPARVSCYVWARFRQ